MNKNNNKYYISKIKEHDNDEFQETNSNLEDDEKNLVLNKQTNHLKYFALNETFFEDLKTVSQKLESRENIQVEDISSSDEEEIIDKTIENKLKAAIKEYQNLSYYHPDENTIISSDFSHLCDEKECIQVELFRI